MTTVWLIDAVAAVGRGSLTWNTANKTASTEDTVRIVANSAIDELLLKCFC